GAHADIEGARALGAVGDFGAVKTLAGDQLRASVVLGNLDEISLRAWHRRKLGDPALSAAGGRGQLRGGQQGPDAKEFPGCAGGGTLAAAQDSCLLAGCGQVGAAVEDLALRAVLGRTDTQAGAPHAGDTDRGADLKPPHA